MIYMIDFYDIISNVIPGGPLFVRITSSKEGGPKWHN